ncbi:MAG TPA: bifunctional nuclease domain-containing protein [Micromonosporaceae bacterium]|nr:bifunctional nuclease domain-containing protein [Micromonosporaceae bacterium]
MRELVVVGVRPESANRRPMVLLRERAGSRYLPIPVGTDRPAADSHPVAPVSAGLLDDVLSAVGAPARCVEVAGGPAGAGRFTFVVGDDVRVAVPPLDAVTLALQLDIPIRCPEAVLDAEGVVMTDDDADRLWRPAAGTEAMAIDATHPMDVTAQLELVVPSVRPEEAGAGLPEALTGIATLQIRQGSEAGAVFPLSGDVVSCGRDPGNQIVLDDVSVSRKHAEFYRQGSAYVVADLGSLNGTYVNAERVKTAILVPGDDLRIGRYVFVFDTG